ARPTRTERFRGAGPSERPMIAVGYHGRVKKALIVAAIAVIVAAIVAAVGIAGAAWMGERRLARAVEVRVVPVAYTRDPAAPKLGQHLFESRGCALCHGADGRGIAVVNADGIEVRSPNITRGLGGVVAD